MELTILNPWWKRKENINEDKHIKDFEEKKYKWKPTLFEEIKLSPNNIYTLRGPRQVGKTTLIKLQIRDLINNGKNEKSIFFWNCDEIVDFRELSSILREYLEFSKSNDIEEKFIFLDEISRIKDWQRSIKSLKDSGELENCCLFITGSHMLDIKHGMERLPGRTGKEGKDLKLLPMSFSEYIKTIKPEVYEKLRKIKELKIDEIKKSINHAKIFDSELKILFNQYLKTGGFPLIVNEFLSNKTIPDYMYEIYARWVIGDLVKWGKQEKILVQLMKTIIPRQSSAISWHTIAKESEIKSHITVSSYIEDLENMFVLLILYFLEPNKKIPDYNRNKKIYLLDPFIYHVFNKKIYFKELEVNSELIEAAIISNLARLTYQGLQPNIFYWKNKKEVDAILKIKNEVFPIEIKYQARISREDYKGLFYFNKGILITKNTLKIDDKYAAVPAHLFLAMI